MKRKGRGEKRGALHSIRYDGVRIVYRGLPMSMLARYLELLPHFK